MVVNSPLSPGEIEELKLKKQALLAQAELVSKRVQRSQVEPRLAAIKAASEQRIAAKQMELQTQLDEARELHKQAMQAFEVKQREHEQIQQKMHSIAPEPITEFENAQVRKAELENELMAEARLMQTLPFDQSVTEEYALRQLQQARAQLLDMYAKKYGSVLSLLDKTFEQIQSQPQLPSLEEIHQRVVRLQERKNMHQLAAVEAGIQTDNRTVEQRKKLEAILSESAELHRQLVLSQQKLHTVESDYFFRALEYQRNLTQRSAELAEAEMSAKELMARSWRSEQNVMQIAHTAENQVFATEKECVSQMKFMEGEQIQSAMNHIHKAKDNVERLSTEIRTECDSRKSQLQHIEEYKIELSNLQTKIAVLTADLHKESVDYEFTKKQIVEVRGQTAAVKGPSVNMSPYKTPKRVKC